MMILLKYIILLVTVVISESQMIPPFLHPETMLTYYTPEVETKQGFKDARRILGFDFTFHQFDVETKNSISNQLTSSERTLYQDIFDLFYADFFNTTQLSFRILTEYIANNSRRIKSLREKIENIYCSSDDYKNETVYVSELREILNLFIQVSAQNFTAPLLETIGNLSPKERKMVGRTVTAMSDIIFGLEEDFDVMGYVNFLKENKFEIKKLAAKLVIQKELEKLRFSVDVVYAPRNESLAKNKTDVEANQNSNNLSEVLDIIKFFTICAEDYPKVKLNLIDLFTSKEKELFKETIAATNNILMGMTDWNSNNTFTKFLEDNKSYVKRLREKVQDIKVDKNYVYNIQSPEPLC